jgi:FG-GAP repeat
VSLDGDTAAIGAQRDDTLAGEDTGSAYVFVRAGTTWAFQRKLRAGDAGPADSFGRSVSVSGDTILVGAFDADPGGSAQQGAAYLYVRRGQLWSELAKLVAVDAVLSDDFGRAVAVTRTMALVGSYGDDDAGPSAGAVYVYAGLDFPSFCDGSDGALAACPCSNPGAPEAGCDLPQGTGGVRLGVLEQHTQPSNRATLAGTGFPAGASPAAVVIRAPGLEAAGPAVFGDGLRCVGTPVVRLAAGLASGGASAHVVGHGAGAGLFFYQLWFRSQPASFCDPSAAFSTSNGRVLAW